MFSLTLSNVLPFFIYRSATSSFGTVFDAVSSRIDDIFSIYLFPKVYLSLETLISVWTFRIFSCLCWCYSHRNQFLGLYQQGKSSTPKAKLRQFSNPCKWILTATKFACAKKIKDSFTLKKRFERWLFKGIEKNLSKLGFRFLIEIEIQGELSGPWYCHRQSPRSSKYLKKFKDLK